MKSNDKTDETGAEFAKPPFLYEIRVKGRLSSEQWTSWFDDLTVSTDKGESTLRGRVPDHAALYGLLARLRDLAVPLVAVKVLDAEAQLKLSQQSRRYDLMINLLLVVDLSGAAGRPGLDHGLCRAHHQHGAGAGVAVCPAGRVGARLLALERAGGLALGHLRWPGSPPPSRSWSLCPCPACCRPRWALAIMLILGAGGLMYLALLPAAARRKHPEPASPGRIPGSAAESVDADRAAEATERDDTSAQEHSSATLRRLQDDEGSGWRDDRRHLALNQAAYSRGQGESGDALAPGRPTGGRLAPRTPPDAGLCAAGLWQDDAHPRVDRRCRAARRLAVRRRRRQRCRALSALRDRGSGPGG